MNCFIEVMEILEDTTIRNSSALQNSTLSRNCRFSTITVNLFQQPSLPFPPPQKNISYFVLEINSSAVNAASCLLSQKSVRTKVSQVEKNFPLEFQFQLEKVKQLEKVQNKKERKNWTTVKEYLSEYRG